MARGNALVWLLAGMVAVGILAAVALGPLSGDSSSAKRGAHATSTLAEAGTGPPAVRQATGAACDADRAALDAAEVAYLALHGSYASEDVLVSDRLIKSPSSLHDVQVTDGGSKYVIVAASGSSCP